MALTAERWCPTCDAPRGPDEQQDGRCVVCGSGLVAPAAERSAEGAPQVAAETNRSTEEEGQGWPEPGSEVSGPSATAAAGPESEPEVRQRPEEPSRSGAPAARLAGTPSAQAEPEPGSPDSASGRRGEPETAPPTLRAPDGGVEADPEPSADSAVTPPSVIDESRASAAEPAAPAGDERPPSQQGPPSPIAVRSGGDTGPSSDDAATGLSAGEPAAGREPAVPPPIPPPPDAGSAPASSGAPAAEPAWRPPPRPPAHRATTDYDTLVAQVEAKVRDGFELFGLVGGSAAGKTHSLKALTYLLEAHAIESQRAKTDFRRAAVPGQTEAEVFHFDYTGPADERWTFVDAGGELYQRLRENDWRRFEQSVRLTRWLDRCQGIFCFLHLRPGHFGGYVLDVDPTLVDDEAERQALRRRQQEERDAREELEFFKHLFLFLRALRAEEGRVEAVVERCRNAASLEEALGDYLHGSPLLDVPVMFFFTQADRYDREDFAIAPGAYLRPRDLEADGRPLSTAAFTARFLPGLFGAVNSQVRRYKFDFLQSYEEAETEKRDADGRPLTVTYWSAPDDRKALLSAGLLAGLELVLRNQPRPRPRWLPPPLDTRRALLLHRLLHPGQWRGVRRNLLGSWRRSPGGGR
jgi:hypothetical protein